jgi:hypothetical protein
MRVRSFVGSVPSAALSFDYVSSGTLHSIG